MTASLPKLSTRLRPPTRYQLRRVEQEVSRFLHGRHASLLLVRHWAGSLSTRLHTRWILLRAATWGPRQRLATAVHALRKSLNPGLGPVRPQARPKPHQVAAHSHRPPYAPPATSALLPRRRDRLESVILWVCFILIGACGVLLFAAGREVRQMRFDIIESRAQIAVLKDHIARLEKEAQAERLASESASPRKVEVNSLMLTPEEEKLVRQFIKVLPSQMAGAPTLKVGQPLGTRSTAPLPDAIVEQIPRLSGARFSIDSSGSIIISGTGSSRADAIVPYTQ
jgi:hypothetical protein